MSLVLDDRAVAIVPESGTPAAKSAHPLVDQAAPIVRVRTADLGAPRPVQVASAPWLQSQRDAHTVVQETLRTGALLLRAASAGPMGDEKTSLQQLEWLHQAAEETRLGLVALIYSAEELATATELADLLEVPASLMQSFSLLRVVGAAGKPVLLNRGIAAGVEDWLLAAEYLLLAGASGVVLCEGGIRTFDHPERPVLDLGAVAYLKKFCPLPVLVAPWPAAGWPELIEPLSRAALQAGADGIVMARVERDE